LDYSGIISRSSADNKVIRKQLVMKPTILRHWPSSVRRHPNVHRTATFGRIDCGNLDFNDSTLVELHRCNLSDSDWNPWAGENVTRIAIGKTNASHQKKVLDNPKQNIEHSETRSR
jgi:hypothetical protein